MQETERRFADKSTTTDLSFCALVTSRDHSEPKNIWHTIVPEVDSHLPAHGLSLGVVHEVMGRTHSDAATSGGFVLGLLRQLKLSKAGTGRSTILWCQPNARRQETGLVHCTGLRMFGLDHIRILHVRGSRKRDVLWALEEGARTEGLLAVVGEVDAPSFTESRRLALAASASGTPVILLGASGHASASAAETRWHVSGVPGRPDPYDSRAPGRARWCVALGKCRGGQPGEWIMEWDHEAYRFALADEFSSRLSETQTTNTGVILPLRRAG